jgi:hypothetical protein
MKTKILIVLLLMGVGFPFISSAKLLALSLEKSNPLENLVTAAHSIAKLEGAPISFDNTKESVENDRKESSNSDTSFDTVKESVENDRGESSDSDPVLAFMVALVLYIIWEIMFDGIKELGDSHSKENKLTAIHLTFIGIVCLLCPIICFNPYIGIPGTLRTLFVMASFWKTDCKK